LLRPAMHVQFPVGKVLVDASGRTDFGKAHQLSEPLPQGKAMSTTTSLECKVCWGQQWISFDEGATTLPCPYCTDTKAPIPEPPPSKALAEAVRPCGLTLKADTRDCRTTWRSCTK
jgi:hypothetical protein